MCFFFSSRRRHTRLVSDWSSDVCSSDLQGCASGEEGIKLGKEARLVTNEIMTVTLNYSGEKTSARPANFPGEMICFLITESYVRMLVNGSECLSQFIQKTLNSLQPLNACFG